jgi:outer membrane protein assembly factor BamB
MTFNRFILYSVLLIILSPPLFAQQPLSDVLATGSGRVILFSPDFSVKWEYPAGNIHEARQLKNGNILFADGKVTEVTPDKKIVFQYAPPNGKEGSFTCQRLDNGNTLIGENFSGLVKEIAPDGTIEFTLQTKFRTENQHHRMRWVRKLLNGNYLVCHSGDHFVREYTPKGETVWEQNVPNIAFAAERLENGNTLISSLDQITEFDPTGNSVWEFKKSELPDLGITNMTGFQRLKNGNLLIGCYAAYSKEGKGVGMFEITRNKKLVWAYQKSTGEKIDKNMMGIQLIP